MFLFTVSATTTTSRLAIIIGGAVGGAVVLVLIVMGLCLLCRRKATKAKVFAPNNEKHPADEPQATALPMLGKDNISLNSREHHDTHLTPVSVCEPISVRHMSMGSSSVKDGLNGADEKDAQEPHYHVTQELVDDAVTHGNGSVKNRYATKISQQSNPDMAPEQAYIDLNTAQQPIYQDSEDAGEEGVYDQMEAEAQTSPGPIYQES